MTRSRLAATCLALEAFLVFFATLAASALSELGTSTVWLGGGALMLLCLLTAALVGRSWGLAVGWVVQVLVVASGLVLPAMFVLGLVFAGLYAWFLRLGARFERDRA